MVLESIFPFRKKNKMYEVFIKKKVGKK